MLNKQSIASEELASYLTEKDNLIVGNVLDSGKTFFVITKVEYKSDIVLVSGDIITDSEWRRNVIFGRSLLLALYPVKYLESVWDNHIWGAFYDKKIAEAAEVF